MCTLCRRAVDSKAPPSGWCSSAIRVLHELRGCKAGVQRTGASSSCPAATWAQARMQIACRRNPGSQQSDRGVPAGQLPGPSPLLSPAPVPCPPGCSFARAVRPFYRRSLASDRKRGSLAGQPASEGDQPPGVPFQGYDAHQRHADVSHKHDAGGQRRWHP